MKVIVVGSSHGGFEAVQEILETRKDVQVQWYEKGDYISFMSWGMYLYLEGIVKDVDTIRYATKEGMEKRGVEVYPEHEIVKINPKDHTVVVRDLVKNEERIESYDKLILSVGSVPFVPPVEGTDLENVVLFGGRQSAEDLRYKTVDPSIKNVVIVGSGYIGIEAAESFAKNGKNVTVIDILQRPLDVYLDQELTDVLEAHMRENNINFVGSQMVQKYLGNGKVEKVITDKGEYDADLVIVSTGVRPNTGWLKDTIELHDNGFVKTDDYMRTSEEDIFAVGNATLVKYNPTDSYIPIALASNARKQGRYAAKNLDGAVAPFKGVQGSSALSIFDYKFASTGINEKSGSRSNVNFKSVYVEQDTHVDYVPDHLKEKIYAKLYYNPETRVVLGAQLLSKHDITANVHAISLAIQGKMTIDDIAYADFFFQPGFNTPWNIINELGLAAQRQER